MYADTLGEPVNAGCSHTRANGSEAEMHYE